MKQGEIRNFNYSLSQPQEEEITAAHMMHNLEAKFLKLEHSLNMKIE